MARSLTAAGFEAENVDDVVDPVATEGLTIVCSLNL